MPHRVTGFLPYKSRPVAYFWKTKSSGIAFGGLYKSRMPLQIPSECFGKPLLVLQFGFWQNGRPSAVELFGVQGSHLGWYPSGKKTHFVLVDPTENEQMALRSFLGR